MVRFQPALAEQLFDIAERERVPQVPAHGAKNQLGLGLSPLEESGPVVAYTGSEIVVEVGRVVDALGPQGVALRVQRLGAIRF